MICIKCQEEMRKKIHQNILIDKCPICQGVWLDGVEFEKIVKQQSTSTIDLYKQSMKEIREEQNSVYCTSMCPKCQRGRISQRAFYSTTIDICNYCNGMFFDKNELKKAIDNSQPFIKKLLKMIFN